MAAWAAMQPHRVRQEVTEAGAGYSSATVAPEVPEARRYRGPWRVESAATAAMQGCSLCGAAVVTAESVETAGAARQALAALALATPVSVVILAEAAGRAAMAARGAGSLDSVAREVLAEKAAAAVRAGRVSTARIHRQQEGRGKTEAPVGQVAMAGSVASAVRRDLAGF